MTLSKVSLKVAAIALGMAPFAALAADEYNTSTGITGAAMPLGLHGADAVNLTGTLAVTDGSPDVIATYDGVAYYFSSEANKAAFEADPAAYMPQFGGFCAFAVSKGKKYDGNPNFADVRDGKLYVFVSQGAFEAYKADPAGTIATAESLWPGMRSTPVSDL